MKNKVVVCVDNKTYYYGEFTDEEISYIQLFSHGLYERRDILIRIREGDMTIPSSFVSRDLLQLNPFFHVWEDKDIEFDYCLKKEDEHEWFHEIDKKKKGILEKYLEIKLSKE